VIRATEGDIKRSTACHPLLLGRALARAAGFIPSACARRRIAQRNSRADFAVLPRGHTSSSTARIWIVRSSCDLTDKVAGGLIEGDRAKNGDGPRSKNS
jgi:hypothetical protein